MLHLIGALIVLVLLVKSPLTVVLGGAAWLVGGPVVGLVVGFIVLLVDTGRAY